MARRDRTDTPRHPALGELELAVMDHLWSAGPADVKAVSAVVGQPRGITLNTVQSTLKRLHAKGLLDRTKVSHAYVYAPTASREAFHRDVLGEVVTGLMDGEPDAMLAAFVDLTERAGVEHLEALERLVARRLAARDDEGRG